MNPANIVGARTLTFAQVFFILEQTPFRATP